MSAQKVTSLNCGDMTIGCLGTHMCKLLPSAHKSALMFHKERRGGEKSQSGLAGVAHLELRKLFALAFRKGNGNRTRSHDNTLHTLSLAHLSFVVAVLRRRGGGGGGVTMHVVRSSKSSNRNPYIRNMMLKIFIQQIVGSFYTCSLTDSLELGVPVPLSSSSTASQH